MVDNEIRLLSLLIGLHFFQSSTLISSFLLIRIVHNRRKAMIIDNNYYT